jgi:DNA end-binding protein Ku
MPATVWKGFISFGLVSIPVRLHVAARNKTLPFHMLHKKDHSRIKEVFYCREEDKPLDREDIVKGYEVAKNEYVVIEDEELKKIAPPTARVMEILQFVKASQVDPLFFDKSYHVAPDATVTRPYALLLEAMTQTKYYGVAKVAMHNREHIVILRPSGNELVLHTMFFVNEIHQAESGELTRSAFKAKELELATRLIETLADKFKPEQYEDEYQANIERLVEQKRKGEKVKAAPKPRKAPVIDLMQALQRSLSEESKAKSSTGRSPTKRKTLRSKRRAAA